MPPASGLSGLAASFRLGLATNLTNAKSMAYYASVLSATAPGPGQNATALAGLGVVLVIASIWYGLVACVLSTPRAAAAFERHKPWIERSFGLAMIIYAALLWVALGLLDPRGGSALEPRARKHWRAVLILLVVTIFYGALVAGLRAGLVHNTFPLMSGSLVPSDYWYAPLGWLNVFENHSAVQFHHRVLATGTLLAILWLWWRLRTGEAPPRTRRAALWLGGAVLLQYALGIVTILRFGQSPPPSGEAVAIGTMHQAGAMVLVTAAAWFAHAARQRRATR